MTLTIAQPLGLGLRERPFRGWVAGRFERAAYLSDERGRVIALTEPSAGRGPFSLVLPASSRIWASVLPQHTAHLDEHTLTVGTACLALGDAVIWDPTLPRLSEMFTPAPDLLAVVRPWTAWWPQAARCAIQDATQRLLVGGAGALLAAVERGNGITDAAVSLAGLGPGLTPAGDDVVLGVMAALWLLGVRDPLPAMAAACAPRTTLLSAAFLLAAAQGQFMESWHRLAHTLARQDVTGTQEAMSGIAAFGASSGRAALAGFAGVLCSRRHFAWSGPRADIVPG